MVFFKSHKTNCRQWRLYSESVNLDEREEPLVFPAFLFLFPTAIFRFDDGTLKPVKLPGGDRFYLKDLLAAYLESQRKGRI
ncbi:hypothetical protein [Pedobacter alluvionis]|uniref:Uncharacterized protein n=1 Tax=Pedobacter alluvionis TaxID=475253 RepID=A0ABY2HL58_9SPHI|nr:hypothetical protein [Pedobacter alluvionis]TFB28352.1 hypothetical protein E3V97_22990 [Pedobacter alluvionis]